MERDVKLAGVEHDLESGIRQVMVAVCACTIGVLTLCCQNDDDDDDHDDAMGESQGRDPRV